jgi:uroporphyrinogen decarboxylase
MMDAIRLTVKSLAAAIPFIGFCGAPFTLASYMIERQLQSYLTTKRFLLRAAEGGARAVRPARRHAGHDLAGRFPTGCSAAQIFDSWGGELSPHDYAVWGVPYLQRIAPQ